MTTPDDEYNDEQDDNQQVPNWRRKLEADAKAGREAGERAAKAEAEAKAAQRELALMRLGIDVNSGPGKLFAKAYDGEITDEAMRNAAEEYGVLAPAEAVHSDQQQAMQRIQNANFGGTPSGGAPHDFERELDAIPQVVDGQWNPDYVNQVLAATAAQAAREGRNFSAVGARVTKFANGAGPVTTPLA